MSVASFAAPFVPELVVLGGALLIFLLDVVGVRRTEAVGAVAAAAGSVALLLVTADLGWGPLAALRTVAAARVDVLPAGGSPLFSFSSLGLVFQAVFLIATVLVALASMSRPRVDRGAPIFFGLK